MQNSSFLHPFLFICKQDFPIFFKVQKLMSLIARVLQLSDFQGIQVTFEQKSDVTHVTPIGKVTSVT